MCGLQYNPYLPFQLTWNIAAKKEGLLLFLFLIFQVS